jgi:hypothetical protein
MHIHLPKPLHGWRAFLGEVGVIVLGVLIALACEALVEDWRWHEKIDHAEHAMRLELSEDDGPQAYGRALVGGCLDQAIGRVEEEAATAPAADLRQWIADYAPPFRVWDSEAWKVVVASDTGSHMGAERLIAWSAPYRLVFGLTEDQKEESRLTIDLRNSLPATGELSAAERQALQRTAAQLRQLNRRFAVSAGLYLTRVGKLDAQVPAPERDAMLRNARALYGNCVTVPNLNSMFAMDLKANLISLTIVP